MEARKKLLIFTDLDGTLLSYSGYSFEAALPALKRIKEQNIPLILCSSKTRSEIEHYRSKLDNQHPFISENGGGIFIPKDYFGTQIADLRHQIDDKTNYLLIRLGAKYPDLRKAIEELRSEGFKLKGFGDMTSKEIADVTDLNLKEAAMAKERDFDEPFIFSGTDDEKNRLMDRINEKGFTYTQGNISHILGNSDKGKAVSILTDFYKAELGDIATVGIGDSPNDIPMLEHTDHAIVVQKPDGNYDPQIDIPNLIKAVGIGPEGWNKAIMKLLS